MLDDDAERRDKKRTAIIIALKSRHQKTVCKKRLKEHTFIT